MANVFPSGLPPTAGAPPVAVFGRSANLNPAETEPEGTSFFFKSFFFSTSTHSSAVASWEARPTKETKERRQRKEISQRQTKEVKCSAVHATNRTKKSSPCKGTVLREHFSAVAVARPRSTQPSPATATPLGGVDSASDPIRPSPPTPTSAIDGRMCVRACVRVFFLTLEFCL